MPVCGLLYYYKSSGRLTGGIGEIVFLTLGGKPWLHNDVYVQNRMFQPVAAFPSITALKSGELRHLNPEVLAHTNKKTHFFKPLEPECFKTKSRKISSIPRVCLQMFYQ